MRWFQPAWVGVRFESRGEPCELLVGSPGRLIAAVPEVDQRVLGNADLGGQPGDGDVPVVQYAPKQARGVESLGVRLVSQESGDPGELPGLRFHVPELPIPQGGLGNPQLGRGPLLRPPELQPTLPDMLAVGFGVVDGFWNRWMRAG